MEQVSGDARVYSATEEVPFSFDELFFSRTDGRGRIKAGNAVFQRISHFSWEELIDKPHNVIRHPDMPRGVFYLLWDEIRRGAPIGAYVKNRSKDGRYYWVFAVVTPVEGGYLSVRLKPASEIFAVVQREYAALLHLETQEELRPSDSTERLLKRLSELGFRDYNTFMAAALSAEMRTRDAQIGRTVAPTITCFDQLMTSAQSLLDEAAKISGANASYRYTPLNLRVHAASLGETGNAIGVISNNYNLLSDTIEANLEDFGKAAQDVASTICDGLFLSCTAQIQGDVATFFEEEVSSGKSDQQNEIRHLLQQKETYQANAAASLRQIKRQAERFYEVTREMKRLASALAAVRVMGKVESGRLSLRVLDDLIADLEIFQTTVAAGLNEIGRINDAIHGDVALLIEREGSSTLQ